jgi:hypothetical protein
MGFPIIFSRFSSPAQHAALTRICSSQLLLKHLEPEQISALRRSPVRTQCVRLDAMDAMCWMLEIFFNNSLMLVVWNHEFYDVG